MNGWRNQRALQVGGGFSAQKLSNHSLSLFTWKANIKSIFSPKGFVYHHLDRRFFNTSSLVEVRAIQISKSLDDRGSRQFNDNVWIKRQNAEVSVSSDNLMKNGGSVSSWEGLKTFVKHSGQQINVSLLKILLEIWISFNGELCL
jgi:hypothetical protein